MCVEAGAVDGVIVVGDDNVRDHPSVPVVPVENYLADQLCAMYESYSNGLSVW